MALLEVVPRDAVTPEQAAALAREHRANAASRIGVAGVQVLVGGLHAFNANYQDAVSGRFPQIVVLIVVGTLLALFLGFRSILVSLKAVALNLLTVADAPAELRLRKLAERLLGRKTTALAALNCSAPLLVRVSARARQTFL